MKRAYIVADALPGEFLGVREGVIPVAENCGSSDQRIARIAYDYFPEGPIVVRYAACRVHRAVESVPRARRQARRMP